MSDDELIRLKKTIIAYKKHDKNRTEYYSGKMKELGELQSVIQELEDSNMIDNLPNLVSDNKKLHTQVKELNKELEVLKLATSIDTDTKNLINKICKLEKQVSEYKEEAIKYKKLSEEYLQTLIKIQSNEKF